MKLRELISRFRRVPERGEVDLTPAEVYSALANRLLTEGYRLGGADPLERRVILSMGGEHVRWTAVIRVWEPSALVTVISRLDGRIPEGLAPRALEHLNRINYEAKLVGNWEMNPDEGWVHYRTSGLMTTRGAIDRTFMLLVSANFASVDRDGREISGWFGVVESAETGEDRLAEMTAIH